MSVTTEAMDVTRMQAAGAADRRRHVLELSTAVRGHFGTLAFAAAVLLLLAFGWSADLERYLTPERGLGYALGILGGSMMLALLVYPARKRNRWLRWLGPVPQWFRIHMTLGILGPACILFHCQFSLGATNSNVALICMLVVAGSGIFGRYFYMRVHNGLYGSNVDLTQLRRDSAAARTSLELCLPESPALRERLADYERFMLSEHHGLLLRFVRLPFTSVIATFTYLRAAHLLRQLLDPSTGDHRNTTSLHAKARLALAIYLDTVRKTAEVDAYRRLFSLWHVLHVPLFVMMVVTAVFHIIAVHVY